MSDVTPPQAGWYADPENASAERWWNGSGWSDHKRDATSASATAPVVAAASSDAIYSPPDVTYTPPGVTYTPPAPAADTGFSFGSPAPAGTRPDPYAPPPAAQPYQAQPYYAAPAAPYAPAPYGAAAPRPGTNGLAVAGLVVSAAGWLVLGVLAAIAGIILSAFGLARARQAEAAGITNSGRGIAMAGIIVGIVVLAIGVIFMVLYFAYVLSAGTGY